MEEKVRTWIEQNRNEIGIGKSDFSLEELTEGESNHVFKLEAEDEMLVKTSDEMIVRTSLDISEDRILHEAKILDLLEEEDIENVPRKIYVENSELIGQPVLVQTYVGDRNIYFNEMNQEQLEELAKRLAEIHSLTPEKYNELFDKDEPETVSMEKELGDNFRKYSRDPYEEYKDLVDKVDPRVESAFRKHKKIYQEMIQEEGDLPWRMVHGDPASNIRASGDEIYLIDWEFCRPGVPRFELIYTFRHNGVSTEKRQEFLEIYRQYRETSEVAEKHSGKWEKFLAFNDMIWAAKRKEKAGKKAKTLPNTREYLKKEWNSSKRCKDD